MENLGKPSLDNKETLLQFCSSANGSFDEKTMSQFYSRTHAKRNNLSLGNALKSSKKATLETVDKTIRRLFFCSSLIVLKQDINEQTDIYASSNRCKSPHCYICRRARTIKIANRLLTAMNDQTNRDIFEGKSWYFLTLTLQHDKNNRNNIYLKELKQYIAKIYRSVVFKKFFNGGLTSVETTINEQYHIHAHSLLIADEIKDVKAAENELRKKWKTLTTDSFQINLRPIKGTEFQRAILETLKYSVKPMKWKSATDHQIELLADWIEQTKNQNFVNTFGTLRGLGITSNENETDSPPQRPEITNFDLIYIGRTSQHKFLTEPETTENGKKRIKATALKSLDPDAAIIDGSDAVDVLWNIRADLTEENLKNVKGEVEQTKIEGVDDWVFIPVEVPF